MRTYRINPVLVVSLLGAIVGLTSRCGSSSSSTPPRACVSGASIACTGPGGCPGFQVCNATGTGFDGCECSDGGGTFSDAASSGSASSSGTASTGSASAGSASTGSPSSGGGSTGGASGTPGAGGSTSGGSSGASGTAAGAVVWKDANGVPVGVIRQIGDTTIGAVPWGEAWEIIDSATGVVWTYNWPGFSKISSFGTASTGWTTGDCSGTEYVGTPPPARFAVQLPGRPGYFVVPDSPTLVQVGLVTTMSNGQCMGTSVATMAVPVSQMKSVTMPTAPPGTPPYHPELL